MDDNKQIQKAGAHSQQVQAGTYIVNNGISEERVRTVFKEMFSLSCKEYTQDAYDIANFRVQAFENSLLPRISKIEGAAEAFADPKFQFLLRDAQKSAASSEREKDYDLLTELLVCHIEKSGNRKTRASVGLAIDIVDDIDTDALCALTVAHSVASFTPHAGVCKQGLAVLDDLYSKVIYDDLPVDNKCMDHLDILNAIRISLFNSINKVPEIYFKRLEGYVCVGIKIDSEEHKKAKDLLQKNNLPSDILIQNGLIDGYICMGFPNKRALSNTSRTSGNISEKLNETEITALNQIWDLYSKDRVLQQEVNKKFIEMWNSFPSLNKLATWWNAMPNAFSITQIGTTLAHTNAKRCDPRLPDLI